MCSALSKPILFPKVCHTLLYGLSKELFNEIHKHFSRDYWAQHSLVFVVYHFPLVENQDIYLFESFALTSLLHKYSAGPADSVSEITPVNSPGSQGIIFLSLGT